MYTGVEYSGDKAKKYISYGVRYRSIYRKKSVKSGMNMNMGPNSQKFVKCTYENVTREL